MSRIGRKPIPVPDKVKLDIKDGMLAVSGPLGNLEKRIPVGIKINIENGEALVEKPAVTRSSRGYQGLVRALLANMVDGVTKGFTRELEISGVGYKAELKGDTLVCTLGFSHTKQLKLPAGVKAEISKPGTNVKISGIDKQLVGQVAAQIRSFKVPEPYKAKGVKYAEETIRRKVGKAGSK